MAVGIFMMFSPLIHASNTPGWIRYNIDKAILIMLAGFCVAVVGAFL